MKKRQGKNKNTKYNKTHSNYRQQMAKRLFFFYCETQNVKFENDPIS